MAVFTEDVEERVVAAFKKHWGGGGGVRGPDEGGRVILTEGGYFQPGPTQRCVYLA